MAGVWQLPSEEVLAQPADDGWTSAAEVIGLSRAGLEIRGLRIGQGPLRVSLLGGCHADEPVGPELLERLAGFLARLPPEHALARRATWFLVPHVNPDGRRENQAWSEQRLPALDSTGATDQIFDLASYLTLGIRELPGDDIEFGFPETSEDLDARPENRAVAGFLHRGAPFHLHATFHGMGFAPGPWFLLEASWIDRSIRMRQALRGRVRRMGYTPFEIDRGGEKGFTRIDEGFSTRPDSQAMKTYFLERGDAETAFRFRPSSMEWVRSLGGDPLTIVSEMPLFLHRGDAACGAENRATLLELAQRAQREELVMESQRLGVRGMPIRDQMRLQLAFLNEALATVQSWKPTSTPSC